MIVVIPCCHSNSVHAHTHVKLEIYPSTSQAEACRISLCLLCFASPCQKVHNTFNVWACRDTDPFFYWDRHICRNLLMLGKNYELVSPHWAHSEACSAVPHFDGPAAGGLGHAVHEASWGCLLQHAAPYTLTHRGKPSTPWLASCSGVFPA